VPRLSKRTVEAAEVRATDWFLWCDDLPGFGVRVLPSGKRSYLVQYRAAGRSRRAVIGLHGRLTCDEARKEAAAMLGQVAKGGDPAEDRVTRRAAMTVAELCIRYMAAANRGSVLGKRGAGKKPLTLAYDQSRIDNHIVPLLGSRLVRDMTHADVARFIRDVSAAKTAGTEKTDKLRGKSIVKGGVGAATRTAGLMGGILSFAVSEGVIPTNPATGVRKAAYKQRVARLDAKGYRALGAALAAKAGEGMNASAIAAARLLALTGCRRNEILALRWSEVDAGGHALRLVDSKEGASVRPIGAAALDVLAGIEQKDGAVYVLPGERRAAPYGGFKGAWVRIRAAAKLDGVTPHTLRHSFASVAGDLGYSESTIAAMLGHAAGSVTGRYTHHLDVVLVAAADKIAAEIARMMAPAD
jgi:integrase